jgi:2-phosphosulfolactate phosphatase
MGESLRIEALLSPDEPLPRVDAWLVIDILRATTVMTSWFAEGGSELYPVGSVEDARLLRESLRQKGERPLLMGERNAVAPEGFDMGNSPLDITPQRVEAYTCAVMATTNGTKAILRAAETGAPVLVACARNASAAVDLALAKSSRSENHLGILCSGREGRAAWDDALCAGLLVSRLLKRRWGASLSDGARLAYLTWAGWENFEASLRTADHAVFLEGIGLGADVAFAAKIDATDVVPQVKKSGGRVFLRSGGAQQPGSGGSPLAGPNSNEGEE